MPLLKRFIHTLFFGNYFYGFCAVCLSVEAALQQQVPLNEAGYYVFIFLATVFYYTLAYTSLGSFAGTNPRSRWYTENRQAVRLTQAVFAVAVLAGGIYFLLNHLLSWPYWNGFTVVMALVFPAAALFYYGISNPAFAGYNLRSVGWLKPFVIGFVWAGLVTVYPLVYHAIANGYKYEPGPLALRLFVKNFMFVVVMAIMFDIKDYAADSNRELKTFVVRHGLRNTIFYILLPLSVLGLGTFLAYALQHNFSAMKIILNSIPFVLLMVVARALQKRKSILFYLAVIDGLLLLKAVCGSVAMLYY